MDVLPPRDGWREASSVVRPRAAVGDHGRPSDVGVVPPGGGLAGRPGWRPEAWVAVGGIDAHW